MNKLQKHEGLHEEPSTSLLRGIKKDIIWRDTLFMDEKIHYYKGTNSQIHL